MKDIKERFKTTFSFDRIIPRLIASWLFFAFILVAKYNDFIELAFAQDMKLYVAAIICVSLFIIFSLPAFFLYKIHTDSWVLLIVSFFLILSWLAFGVDGTEDTLKVLPMVIIFIFVAVYFYFKNKEFFLSHTPKRRTVIIVCSLFALISFLFSATTLVFRYETYSSPNYDFGIFANIFYNLKTKGLPLASSERDMIMSHFNVHISPIFYLILPIYLIFPYAITIQIIQPLFISLSMIPLLLILKHYNFSHWHTILIAALFAFFPALTTSGYYDFHENCLLVLPLMFMFFFLEKKKYPLMYVASLLVLSVKEDAAIYIFIFGIYLILSKKSYVHGAILSILSVGYFFAAISILNSSGAGAMTYRYGNLILNSSDGILGAIKTIFLNPGYALSTIFTTSASSWDKVVYFIEMFLPLAFIPFMIKKPARLVLLVPVLLNLLTNYIYQYNIFFQYNYGISAFLFYLLIINLSEIKEETRGTILSIASGATAILYICLALGFSIYYVRTYINYHDYYEGISEVLEIIPDDASVSAPSYYVAHLANRDEIYEVSYHGNVPDVDYVVLSSRDTLTESRINIYEGYGYTIIADASGVVILQSPSA